MSDTHKALLQDAARLYFGKVAEASDWSGEFYAELWKAYKDAFDGIAPLNLIYLLEAAIENGDVVMGGRLRTSTLDCDTYLESKGEVGTFVEGRELTLHTALDAPEGEMVSYITLQVSE